MDYLVESKRLAVLLDTIVASYDLPIAGSPTVGYPAPVLHRDQNARQIWYKSLMGMRQRQEHRGFNTKDLILLADIPFLA